MKMTFIFISTILFIISCKTKKEEAEKTIFKEIENTNFNIELPTKITSLKNPSDFLDSFNYAHSGDWINLQSSEEKVVTQYIDTDDDATFWEDYIKKNKHSQDSAQKFFDDLSIAHLSESHDIQNYLCRIALKARQIETESVSQDDWAAPIDQDCDVPGDKTKIVFNPKESGLSYSNAYLTAEMSRATFWSKPDLKNFLTDGNFATTKYITFDTSESLFFYSKHKDFEIVAIRGSDNEEDWKNNFLFTQSDDDWLKITENGKIHQGFLRSAKSFWQHIEQEMNAAIKSHTPVFFTGHSRGGALAQLLALQFYKAGGKPIIYTFGQPRVVNEDLANAIMPLLGKDIFYYRFTLEGDIVPQLPPAAPSAVSIGGVVNTWFEKLKIKP